MNKSIGFYSARYAGFYVLIMIVVTALVFALYTFVPEIAGKILGGGGGTGVGVVTVILPPMMVAQAFYKHEMRRMTGGEGWLMALVFTILGFVLSAAAMWIGTLLQPLSTAEAKELGMLLNEERSVFVIVMAGVAVFMLLINKLMLWAGVRGEIKKAEKIAAKAARRG